MPKYDNNQFMTIKPSSSFYTLIFENPEEYTFNINENDDNDLRGRQIIYVHVCSNTFTEIKKLDTNTSSGFAAILNTSSYVLSITITRKDEEGRHHQIPGEYILPGQFKKLIGEPGLIWHIHAHQTELK